MKKQTQQILEKQLNETVEQLKQNSDKNHENYLDHVRKMAYTLAQAGLPKLGDKLAPYTDELIGFYETSRTDILLQLASSIQAMRTKINLSEPMKLINDKRDNLKNLVRVFNNRLHDRDNIKIQRDVFSHKLYSALLWISCGLESLWFALIFGVLGDGNFAVGIGALVMSIALIQGTKIATLKIRDTKEKIALWKKFAVAFAFCSIVTALGYIRYSSIIVTSDNTIVEYRYLNHPIIFIILTSIPLIATALVTWKYILSEDEEQQLREYERLNKECIEQRKTIANCEQEIKELTDSRNDIVNAGIRGEHSEKVLIARFDGFVKQSVGQFKLENLKHRMDNITPDCFNEPSPTLPPIHPNQFNNQENHLS